MFLDEKKQGNYRNTTKSAANLLELSTIQQLSYEKASSNGINP